MSPKKFSLTTDLVYDRNQGPISVSVLEQKLFSLKLKLFFNLKKNQFFPFSWGDVSFYKLENKTRSSKIGSKFGFGRPTLKPNYFNIGKKILTLKWGSGIGYSISRKYWQIWVLVSVSNLNKNSCFGCTLPQIWGSDWTK